MSRAATASPAVLLATLFLLFVVLGLSPALRAWRVSEAACRRMREKGLQAQRIREGMRSHPEKTGVSASASLADEAALILFLQDLSDRSDVTLESIKPVFPAQPGREDGQAERLLVRFRSPEPGLRSFVEALEATPMPWRAQDLQIRAAAAAQAGLAVCLSLEKMDDKKFSLEQAERFLAEEVFSMKTLKNQAYDGRAVFRPPARQPAGPQDKGPLAVLFEGWRLIGIIQGAGSRAVIEDKKTGRVFSIRPGDAVAGASVESIDADGIIFNLGDETLRLVFE